MFALAPPLRWTNNTQMNDLSHYPHLAPIETPADLRLVPDDELPAVADELRQYLIEAVASSGGHFGAGLGVVELTVALHHEFDTPHDRLVWDVGHQCYPHKILTGRRERITTIKKKDGLAPFPRREESEYDTFGVGHSSTSISAALGMAIAAQRKGDQRKVVAVIGDGNASSVVAYAAPAPDARPAFAEIWIGGVFAAPVPVARVGTTDNDAAGPFAVPVPVAVPEPERMLKPGVFAAPVPVASPDVGVTFVVALFASPVPVASPDAG